MRVFKEECWVNNLMLGEQFDKLVSDSSSDSDD
jgi:hypothetical protein